MNCTLCPRNCNVDRQKQTGRCGENEKLRIALYGLHFHEEPPISGTKGSGAVFFSGCPLRCVYCQNSELSRSHLGKEYTPEQFAELLFHLRDMGANNINLITPTHFSAAIAEVLKEVKPKLNIPVIYNCGGYEKVEALRLLEGLIDVYLPDLKYYSSALSAAYSDAPDYFPTAAAAIAEMTRQQPEVILENGLIKRGVIIRHLVLPNCVNDSLKLIEFISSRFPTAYLSLMRQYTPEFYRGEEKNLKRKLTSYEYDKVLNFAQSKGLKGFMQLKGCENSSFTPDFAAGKIL